MKPALTVIAVAFVSAFIPVVSIETYVVVMAAAFREHGDLRQLLVLAAAATIGQMAGKYVWYEAGRNSARWPWLQRKLERPKIAAQLEKWTTWADHHRKVAGLVLFASACAGLPPFLIMSIVAGRLKFSRVVFIVTGVVGRFLRFLIAAGLVEWLQTTVPPS